MARTRDAVATRTALLDAARRQFGRLGYDATTTRSVAAEAGVDPALVVRYFGGKQQLFLEAADLSLELPDLTGVAAGDLAGVLLPRFFAVWEEGGTFLPLLRAAATDPDAAELLRSVFREQVAPALASVVPDHPAERAALMGTTVLGLAFVRFVVRAEPIASMSHDDLVAWIGPVVEQYLTGPAPS